jgi:hypothetical protein
MSKVVKREIFWRQLGKIDLIRKNIKELLLFHRNDKGFVVMLNLRLYILGSILKYLQIK